MTSAGGSKNHRLLTLAPNPDISGCGPIAKLAYRLVHALQDAGYEVDTELWGRHQRDEGLFQKVVGRAGDLLRIRKRISRTTYDLVFVHTTHDWRALIRDLSLMLLGPSGVKWVLLIHGSRFRSDRRLFKLVTDQVVRRASAILLLSSEEISQWRRLYPDGKFYRVANAFEPLGGVQSGAPASRRLTPEILFAGYLIREKGVYDLLEAFAAVRSTRSCHLTVAGLGPEADSLRERAAQLGVAEDVEFTGYLLEDGLSRVYERSDVFVLPTYFGEGLPTVLLEAMGFGLAIITTRIRGAADYLVDGENVLFVPSNSPDVLAEAIHRLLDDDGLRARLGENNLRKVGDFAPARVVPAYERAFADVMGEA